MSVCFVDDASLRPVSMWVVGDLESLEGRQLIGNAFKYMVGQDGES